MLKPMRRQNGFTAIEMILVIAIIGVLAALIVTGLTTTAESAKKSQAQMDISTIYKALEEYKFKFNDYPTDRSMEFLNTTGSTKMLDILVNLRLLTIDQARVQNNRFCDPWGYPYICASSIPGGATGAVADMGGAGGVIYIYSQGAENSGTPDAEKWVYIKGGK